MKEENFLEIHKKKIDINAANSYQYNKIKSASFYFVPCTVEETYDEVIFRYDTEGLLPFSEVRSMGKAEKYGFLLQLLEAVRMSPEYIFEINPENLFFDSQKRIRIMERDICGNDMELTEKRLLDFKAIAGYLLQKKYTYENLRNGGMSLLKRNSNTKSLLEIQDLDNMAAVFKASQQEELEKQKQQQIYVKRSKYQRNLWVMGIAIAACIGLGILAGYQNQYVIIPQNRALMAERAYMEQNFTGVVDALAGIPTAQLDKHEKYLLAVVAVRGQSVDTFDINTKERLLSKLSYDGDEYLLDYWISLGRMDVDEALDIAMRMSDHQLTLYAYLQKIDMISADNQLSGEEKVSQIESLKGKIKTLAEELGIEYKEK